MVYVIWPGTPDEGRALADAIAHWCECEFGIMGVRTRTCPAHQAFTSDQNFVNRLVFQRRYWADRVKDRKDAT